MKLLQHSADTPLPESRRDGIRSFNIRIAPHFDFPANNSSFPAILHCAQELHSMGGWGFARLNDKRKYIKKKTTRGTGMLVRIPAKGKLKNAN